MWHNFRKKIVSLLHFLSGRTTRQLTGQVDELKANQDEIKAGQESAVNTICRGSAMVINLQNQILQRLDDLEAKIKEIKIERKN